MADPQAIQSLLAFRSAATAAPAGAATNQSKVKELATQFEAMLLSQMLKNLQTSMVDGEDSPDGAKTGPLGDVMTQELGLALSRAGGFGLGNMLAGAMNRTPGLATPPPSQPIPGVSPDLTRSRGGAENITTDTPGLTGQAETSKTPGVAGAFTVPAVRVSSAYGWRNDPIDGGSRFHEGVDLPMAVGSTVKVPADGHVVSASQEPGYGLTVVVSHGQGVFSRYTHLSSTDVRPGDPVRAGDQIARSGNSGRSTGPHLHFEVTANGQSVDPEGWASAVVGRPPAIGQ